MPRGTKLILACYTGNSASERWELVPRVAIKTGFPTPDGEEEVLIEYLCDWPGCPNMGVHLLGVIRELRAMAIVCDEHSSGHQQTNR